MEAASAAVTPDCDCGDGDGGDVTLEQQQQQELVVVVVDLHHCCDDDGWPFLVAGRSNWACSSGCGDVQCAECACDYAAEAVDAWAG